MGIACLRLLLLGLAWTHLNHLRVRAAGSVQAQGRLEQTVLQVSDQRLERDLLQLAVRVGHHLPLDHILLGLLLAGGCALQQTGEQIVQIERR